MKRIMGQLPTRDPLDPKSKNSRELTDQIQNLYKILKSGSIDSTTIELLSGIQIGGSTRKPASTKVRTLDKAII